MSKKRQQLEPRFIVDAHGKPTAVILDLETYNRIAGRNQEKPGDGRTSTAAGLLGLSDETLGFWDNPIDDEVWSNA